MLTVPKEVAMFMTTSARCRCCAARRGRSGRALIPAELRRARPSVMWIACRTPSNSPPPWRVRKRVRMRRNLAHAARTVAHPPPATRAGGANGGPGELACPPGVPPTPRRDPPRGGAHDRHCGPGLLGSGSQSIQAGGSSPDGVRRSVHVTRSFNVTCKARARQQSREVGISTSPLS
jgi:hypothetical protein